MSDTAVGMLSTDSLVKMGK